MLLIDWAYQKIPRAPHWPACVRHVQALAIMLINHLDAHQQAVISSGTDTFISKGETPERVAERLRTVVAGFRPTQVSEFHGDVPTQQVWNRKSAFSNERRLHG